MQTSNSVDNFITVYHLKWHLDQAKDVHILLCLWIDWLLHTDSRVGNAF